MDTVSKDFVNALIHLTSGLQTAHDETLEYWHPDEPPVTTLFAALGDRIADEFKIMDQDMNSRIFALIESAMASGDQELVTAVATGLIEAMISRVAANEESLQQLTQALGLLSRKHAKVWLGK